jgi:Skp family chaperone for outer membrane proteins
VKRTAILMLGVVAALGAAVYASRTWAQTGATTTGGATAPAAAPAQARTRIALLNLAHVIRNYEKFKAYQDEIKHTIKPYQEKETVIKTRGETLAKEGQQTTTTAQRREAIEKELKDLQRNLEDLKNDFQKVMGKKQEEQLVRLYGDIYTVAERHAQSHNFDLVLHYNDGHTAEERWSATNVARKMQAGALVPLYYTGGMDISQEVITTLNAMYKQSQATTPAAR